MLVVDSSTAAHRDMLTAYLFWFADELDDCCCRMTMGWPRSCALLKLADWAAQPLILAVP